MNPRFCRPLLFLAATIAGMAWPVSPGLAQQDSVKGPVPSGNVTFSFWGIASQPWQVMIDAFQKTYPNLKVKWTRYSTDEMKQAVRVASSAGKMSDAWFNWGGSLASPYDEGGHALELTSPLMAEYGVGKHILPAALDLARYKGKLYGVPIWVRPMTLFYKKSIFDKFGLSAPKTFEELDQVCQTLKSKGIIPVACGGKFSWMTMRTTDFFIEHYAGPAMHDKLFAMEESYNSPAVIQAFTKLKEWVTKGYFNDGFISLDPDQALPLLFQDKAAMIFQGPWIEDQNIIKTHQDPNNYVPIVAPADQKPVRISGFQEQIQVWSKSKPDAQKAALLFASFITTPEVAQKYIGEFGAPSAVVGVLPPKGHPITAQMVDWLQGDVQLYLPTDQALPQEIVNAFFQAQDSVVLGTLTPEAAAAQIQKAVEAYKGAHKP
ncbi:MAG: extracellular solute-binding protein [Verrucomicrobia bacterium]|nr:extracellular solute-binding protein [Verrucomicrobiota bacterium]